LTTGIASEADHPPDPGLVEVVLEGDADRFDGLALGQHGELGEVAEDDVTWRSHLLHDVDLMAVKEYLVALVAELAFLDELGGDSRDVNPVLVGDVPLGISPVGWSQSIVEGDKVGVSDWVSAGNADDTVAAIGTHDACHRSCGCAIEHRVVNLVSYLRGDEGIDPILQELTVCE